MKRVIKIAMLSIGWICACWMLSACSSADERLEDDRVDGSTVQLTIHAAMPGIATRADGDIPEREQTDQLRIIVVDKDTKRVEYNSLRSFPYRDGTSYSVSVGKNGTKLVYLLANAEDYVNDISNVQDLDDKIIQPLPDGRLPFTSKYEIEVKEEDVAATCYIAIAAVKFSFTFTNSTTGGDIEVSDFGISSIADRSYLLPHNNEWDKWIENVTGTGEKKYFTDYEIPSGTGHNEFIVPIPSSGSDGGAGTGTGTSSFIVPTGDNNTYIIPDFYCHESKHILPFPDVKDQQYFIQFTIAGKEYIAEIQGLSSLIRSTHVIVNINIKKLIDEGGEHDIVVWGKIIDWIDLDPVEGGLEEIVP